MMRKTAETSAGQQYPVFSQAPPYIRESLVFPYADGLAFQDAVFRKLGKDAFAEVFVNPPASSGQIMHPERYLAHAGVAIPDTPAVPNARDFRKLGDGTLGEFDLRVLLTQYASADDGVPRRSIWWAARLNCWSTNAKIRCAGGGVVLGFARVGAEIF